MNYKNFTGEQIRTMMEFVEKNTQFHDPHPAVSKALSLSTISTADLFGVFLELPHVSTCGRLAYTKGPEEALRDVREITTAFSYVKSRFPDLTPEQVWSTVGPIRSEGDRLPADLVDFLHECGDDIPAELREFLNSMPKGVTVKVFKL